MALGPRIPSSCINEALRGHGSRAQVSRVKSWLYSWELINSRKFLNLSGAVSSSVKRAL